MSLGSLAPPPQATLSCSARAANLRACCSRLLSSCAAFFPFSLWSLVHSFSHCSQVLLGHPGGVTVCPVLRPVSVIFQSLPLSPDPSPFCGGSDGSHYFLVFGHAFHIFLVFFAGPFVAVRLTVRSVCCSSRGAGLSTRLCHIGNDIWAVVPSWPCHPCSRRGCPLGPPPLACAPD